MVTMTNVVVWAIGLAIELLLANWVASDARRHGRRAIAWGLAVLMTGPIGLAFYLVTRSSNIA
jgi:apolipoprotein N-acyltransferase